MEQIEEPSGHEPWQALDRWLREGRTDRVRALIDELPAGEAARTVDLLGEEGRRALLAVLEPDRAAALLESIPEPQAAEMIERIDPTAAAAIVGELPSDEQADILGSLDPASAEAILQRMVPVEAAQARQLASYPEDCAGGLMVAEYLAFPRTATVQDVRDDLSGQAERYRDYVVQYSYVVDEHGRLVGVLRLRDLLLARRDQRIAELMIPDPLAMRDTASLDELRAFFARQAFFGVPVVDDAGLLVGLVRRADVESAVAERSGNEYLKTQGIVGGEELRSMPLLHRARRRLSWLSANILLNVAAASVIALFQETLAAVIALAVFLPIISDMSGCSGNQAVAVTLRELSVGLVQPRDVWRVWGKEIGVGVINGCVLGCLIALVAVAWKGNPYLGLVVGAAMALNTMLAVSIGGTVPLVMRRLGRDPALASGPILTTITDMCGFLLVLGMAAALVPRLT